MPRLQRKKGPNVATIAAETGDLVELFNPRNHVWDEHFSLVGTEIIGTSAIGRATTLLLDLNGDERVAVRAQLQEEGLY